MEGLLGLWGDKTNEGLPDWIDAQVETFQSKGANQNKIVWLSTQYDSRRYFLLDDDFSGSDWLRNDPAVSILNLSGSKRGDADLLQQSTGHLGKMGARVHKSLQLEGTSWVGEISYDKFHVKSSHQKHCR